MKRETAREDKTEYKNRKKLFIWSYDDVCLEALQHSMTKAATKQNIVRAHRKDIEEISSRSGISPVR